MHFAGVLNEFNVARKMFSVHLIIVMGRGCHDLVGYMNGGGGSRVSRLADM